MVSAQSVDNNIAGKFITNDTTQIYSNFSFDNNGKVIISDLGQGDYFVKDDTVIIFPDKDIFKFLYKDGVLVGISGWVENGRWTLTQEAVPNRRTNDLLAKNNAQLLFEYYQKTRLEINPMDILFDESIKQRYMTDLESLCNRKLVRACKELFGMETVNAMGGIGNVLSKGAIGTIADSSRLLGIANKVVAVDSAEGYHLLSLYYMMSNQEDKGERYLNKSMEMGNRDAAITSLKVELARMEETVNEEFYPEPVRMSTLQFFSKLNFEELESELSVKYGFQEVDQIENKQYTALIFKNSKNSMLSKFVYADRSKNRVEYTTNDKNEVEVFKIDLAGYKMTEKRNGVTGEVRQIYKSAESLNGECPKSYQVEIVYPGSGCLSKPTTIILTHTILGSNI